MRRKAEIAMISAYDTIMQNDRYDTSLDSRILLSHGAQFAIPCSMLN